MTRQEDGATFALAGPALWRPPPPGPPALASGPGSAAGEVDHAALIARLCDYDGWAVSTSKDALRELLPLCPRDVDVHPWVKPIGVSSETYGAHNTWEALIVFAARRVRPGFRDWLYAMPARRGGELIGRKPLAFAAHLFRALGAHPGDTLDDLYPGTGMIGRCWETWTTERNEQQ